MIFSNLKLINPVADKLVPEGEQRSIGPIFVNNMTISTAVPWCDMVTDTSKQMKTTMINMLKA